MVVVRKWRRCSGAYLDPTYLTRHGTTPVEDITEGVQTPLQAPYRYKLQCPVIKEMGPLIVAISLIGGAEMAWPSSTAHRNTSVMVNKRA